LPSFLAIRVCRGVHEELEAVTRLFEEVPQKGWNNLAQHEISEAENQIPSLLVEIFSMSRKDNETLSYSDDVSDPNYYRY
jgi:hypothetical protein